MTKSLICHRNKNYSVWFKVLALFIFIGLVLKYVYAYLTFYVLGMGTSICLCLFISIKAIPTSNNGTGSRSNRKRKFKFIHHFQVPSSTHSSETRSTERTNSLSENEHIFPIVDDFINLIINEFIDSWFQQLSTSREFQESIRSELRFVIENVSERLRRIDVPQLLVSTIIPMLNDHFNNFIKAEDTVRLRNFDKLPIDSVEYKIAVARQYDRGKIHPGVTITRSETDDVNEKKYLRKRINEIVPLLLSKKEYLNEISTSLVREILACTVLSNLVKVFGSSDSFNLLIDNLLGESLRRRQQVKRLRAALEKHTQQLKYKNSMRLPVSETTRSMKFKQTSIIDIDKFLDPRKSDKYIQDQLQLIKVHKSLNGLKIFYQDVLNRLLSVNRENLDDQASKKFLSKRLNMLKETTSETITTLMKRINTNYLALGKEIKLIDVLNNSELFGYFYEFMNYRKRQKLLVAWQQINSIMAPLEDSVLEEDGESNLLLSLDFFNLQDIKKIYQNNLHDLDLGFNLPELKMIQQYVYESDENKRYDLYLNARKCIFKIQAQIYDEMSTKDFPYFLESDNYSKILLNDSIQIEKKSTILDDKIPETNLELYYPDQDGEHDELSPDVIRAVEDAFSEIMNTNETPDGSQPKDEKVGIPSSEESYDNRKNLFGDNSSLFGDDKNYIDNAHKAYKLFDDTSDDSGTDGESINLENESYNQNTFDLSTLDLQLFLAGPGDLKLTEEIDRLSVEIDKLLEQRNILGPLIRKSELTNNLGQLKVLKKSEMSLEREINLLELQKQQYMVQENENSLYGKSQVRIQSYISGNENGKEFYLYIVEVQKLSNQTPHVVTAGWIVARRFSQFFKLHEYLKSQYPVVSNIKFPKRVVLVLNFQQKLILEQRKVALEEYLQELIQIPEVCSNKAFRSFLSSENFSIRKNQTFAEYSSSNKNKRNSIEIVASKLYNGISNRLTSVPVNPTGPRQIHDTLQLENFQAMQSELRLYDEAEIQQNESKVVFVKPICDLLISVFRLNSSKSWLRGRALLVILQQIFGTTIERKIRETLDSHINQDQGLKALLMSAKDAIFPNGSFRSLEQRSSYQKSATRHEAKAILEVFMNDTCSKVFGSSNTHFAYTKIFSILQNSYVNEHLILSLLDALIIAVFPEVSASSGLESTHE